MNPTENCRCPEGINPGHNEYALSDRRTEEGREYVFDGMVIRTDRFSRPDPSRVLGLGLACHLILTYIANHKETVKGRRVFEPFAGSGAMGLYASRVGAAHVDLLDINPRAVEFQAINRDLNDLSSETAVSHLDDIRTFQLDQPYDLVVANPPFVPTPDGISGTGNSNGGWSGCALIEALLSKINEFLRPEGQALIYAYQIENADGPIMLEACKRLSGFGVELTRGWEEPVPVAELISTYRELFPDRGDEIAIWERKLRSDLGSDLGLNDYVIHLDATADAGITYRQYDGSKYGDGFFREDWRQRLGLRAKENLVQ